MTDEANTAGACIREGCPSDSLFWEPLFVGGLVVSDVFTCTVCGIHWSEGRKE